MGGRGGGWGGEEQGLKLSYVRLKKATKHEKERKKKKK